MISLSLTPLVYYYQRIVVLNTMDMRECIAHDKFAIPVISEVRDGQYYGESLPAPDISMCMRILVIRNLSR